MVLIVGLSSSASSNTMDESQSQFEVVSCSPDDVLTEKFRRTLSKIFLNSLKQSSGETERGRPGISDSSSDCSSKFNSKFSGEFEWSGADAAYSIPIGTGKTLWLFGDTFLRKSGSSPTLQMINNSIAIQKIGNTQIHDINQSSLEFFWRQTRNKNNSFFEETNAKRAKHWLWPLDGLYRNGAVFEFINEICKSSNASPAFSFAISNQLLLKIENTMEPVEKWKMTLTRVEAPKMQIGNAVTQDEQFAYIYCSYYPAKKGMDLHPQIVIRLPLDTLDKIDSHNLFQIGEVWSNSGHWIKNSTEQPQVIMQDGAPEFSVTRAKGLDGYFAVYFPSGFGTKIMLRHALRPEGPWSEPQCIYDCPVDTEQFFVYSAKSHPALCMENGEFCITYCENWKSSNLSSPEPEKFYYPHAIKLRIKKVASRSELVH